MESSLGYSKSVWITLVIGLLFVVGFGYVSSAAKAALSDEMMSLMPDREPVVWADGR